MKAITSFEHAPLGLVGHLRVAIEAWQQERAAHRAGTFASRAGTPAVQNLSYLTAAELHEYQQTQSGTFSETGDVLSGLVLNWPSPSGKGH